MVRPGVSGDGLRRLGTVDAAYGALAGTVIAFGVSRVLFGANDAEFYTENPVFWLKMAAFATVGLLSIAPTMRYRRWRLAADRPPSDAEVATARRFITLQLCAFALIPVFAALMARGIGR
jgi:putative membrane protein